MQWYNLGERFGLDAKATWNGANHDRLPHLKETMLTLQNAVVLMDAVSPRKVSTSSHQGTLID